MTRTAGLRGLEPHAGRSGARCPRSHGRLSVLPPSHVERPRGSGRAPARGGGSLGREPGARRTSVRPPPPPAPRGDGETEARRPGRADTRQPDACAARPPPPPRVPDKAAGPGARYLRPRGPAPAGHDGGASRGCGRAGRRGGAGRGGATGEGRGQRGGAWPASLPPGRRSAPSGGGAAIAHLHSAARHVRRVANRKAGRPAGHAPRASGSRSLWQRGGGRGRAGRHGNGGRGCPRAAPRRGGAGNDNGDPIGSGGRGEGGAACCKAGCE